MAFLPAGLTTPPHHCSRDKAATAVLKVVRADKVI